VWDEIAALVLESGLNSEELKTAANGGEEMKVSLRLSRLPAAKNKVMEATIARIDY
jgi:hypothetical protein